jgi:predicted transcriptional regulator
MPGYRWKTEDDEKLKAAAGRLTAKQVAQKLGRSEEAVRNRAQDKGIKLAKAREPWTACELTMIKQALGQQTVAQIAQALGRPETSVRTCIKNMGWSVKPGQSKRRRWSVEDIERLRQMAEVGCSPREVADALDRKITAVHNKAQRMGVRFKVKEQPNGTKFRVWTKAEETALWGLAERYSIEQAARRLNRPFDSVQVKASRLGISFRERRMTLSELAKLLGVGIPTVRSRRDKLGLRFRTNKTTGPQSMRGPTGAEIVAIARDILENPPMGNLGTTPKRLREVIQEYEGWE